MAAHHELTAKQTAQPIMQALAGYKADVGRYPDALVDLMPLHISSVPKAPVAFIRHLPYRYRTSEDKASFSISFPKPAGYWHFFDSKNGYWSMHD